jgi:adenylate cyclase
MSEAGDRAFFRSLETHRVRGFVRLMRHLPSDPRCAVCRAPYGGVGGRIMGRVGFAPSRKNPRLCSQCFEKAPMGGVEMEVGILFADVRGFTSLAERQAPDAVAALLNRFYATAVDVLCEHAIIDKLVGDQVMALYIPALGRMEDPKQVMLAHARALLAALGYGTDDGPFLEAGIGLDFGDAFVGNVGHRWVYDFTAVGDVVNTAFRLQGCADGGEVVASSRLADRIGSMPAEPVDLELKGRREPVSAFRFRPMAESKGQPRHSKLKWVG